MEAESLRVVKRFLTYSDVNPVHLLTAIYTQDSIAVSSWNNGSISYSMLYQCHNLGGSCPSRLPCLCRLCLTVFTAVRRRACDAL